MGPGSVVSLSVGAFQIVGGAPKEVLRENSAVFGTTSQPQSFDRFHDVASTIIWLRQRRSVLLFKTTQGTNRNADSPALLAEEAAGSHVGHDRR
jgi:hypothetical protein